MPPLLRGRDGALVVAGTAIDSVVAQLAPIQSHAALASSFAREANPDDPVVRAAYGCVWADLTMRVALAGTRRARNRATMAGPRGRSLKARG